MPLFTFSYCLICYKKDVANPVPPPQKEGDPPELFEKAWRAFMKEKERVNQKREICRRFGTLATRYLGIDPYHFHPNRTLKSKREINNDNCCDSCLPTLKSFCELYDCWKYLEIQMNQRVGEIVELLKTSDKENGAWRAALKKDLEDIGDNTIDLMDFRKEFVYHAYRKMKKSFPRIRLERDPDFVPVKVIASKKLSKLKKGGVPTSNPDRDPASSGQSQKKSGVGGARKIAQTDRIKRKRISDCSRISSESEDSLFTPILLPPVNRKRNASKVAQSGQASEAPPVKQKRSSPRSSHRNLEESHDKQVVGRRRSQNLTGDTEQDRSRSTTEISTTLEDSDVILNSNPSKMKGEKRETSMEPAIDEENKLTNGRIKGKGRPKKGSSEKGRNSGGKAFQIKFDFERRSTDG